MWLVCHEFVQFETELIGLRGAQRHGLDDVGNRVAHAGAPAFAQPQEGAGALGEIEREVPGGLEDAQLAHPVAGHARRGHRRDGTTLELHARVHHVEVR